MPETFTIIFYVLSNKTFFKFDFLSNDLAVL